MQIKKTLKFNKSYELDLIKDVSFLDKLIRDNSNYFRDYLDEKILIIVKDEEYQFNNLDEYIDYIKSENIIDDLKKIKIKSVFEFNKNELLGQWVTIRGEKKDIIFLESEIKKFFEKKENLNYMLNKYDFIIYVLIIPIFSIIIIYLIGGNDFLVFGLILEFFILLFLSKYASMFFPKVVFSQNDILGGVSLNMKKIFVFILSTITLTGSVLGIISYFK